MYIDVEKAQRRGMVGHIRVYLNGKKVQHVTAAKHGRNGFVEYIVQPVRVKGYDIVRAKKRGNVKISFNRGRKYGK